MTRASALVSALVSTHRVFFIAGTVVLAVGTSRLADKPCVLANWLLSLAGASLMVVGDSLLETDRISTDLHRSSGRQLRDCRTDMFSMRHPRIIVGIAVVGLASGAAALVV